MSDDFELKLVIRELVRTLVFFPNIKLLVDKITVIDVPAVDQSTPREAYLLHLTDGDMTIQALLKRRLHKYVTRSGIRKGSYVVLKEYTLATGKRLNGDGSVRYLAISDFYSIGEREDDVE